MISEISNIFDVTHSNRVPMYSALFLYTFRAFKEEEAKFDNKINTKRHYTTKQTCEKIFPRRLEQFYIFPNQKRSTDACANLIFIATFVQIIS